MTEPIKGQTRHDLAAKLIADVFQGLPSALGASIAAKVRDLPQGNERDQARGTFIVMDLLVKYVEDMLTGRVIVPVPRQLVETVNVSNRTVSLILDGQIHLATGILVGPSSVLTAAHLFFEEDGGLIDPTRAKRIVVEAHTTYLGNIIKEGPRVSKKLFQPDSNDDWLIDPKISAGKADRDVRALDFVIVKLEEDLGDEPLGDEKRGWFEIPTAGAAQVLSPDLAIRVFEFLDRGDLLTSSGYVRDVTANGYRVLHTASTADSASGAAIVDDELNLVAMHVGGPASSEWPKSNRGLPIRRVAEAIDQVRGGNTIRLQLK